MSKKQPTTSIISSIIRIENDAARGILVALWFPVVLVDWLLCVAVNAPLQLLTPRPYAMAFAMFLASVDGYFIGESRS